MSGLKLILGSGTTLFGQDASLLDNCFKVLNKFFASGFKEIDTAFVYNGGNSEQTIGQYIKNENIRDKVVVATKAAPFSMPLTRKNVLSQANTSLERLQTSYVDIFFLHAPDHNTPIEETLEAVQQLYTEGKFKEFGLSNYAAWEVVDIYHICKARGWVLPTVYQGMYNPITRMVEEELFPALKKFGMRFYAYNPLAMGFLTGKYSKGSFEKPEGRFLSGVFAETYQRRYWRASTFDAIELLQRTLQDVYGNDEVSLAQASLRWMIHHSCMKPGDGIILGCSKIEHLVSNLGFCKEGPLDQRVVEAFDEAWKMDKASCVTYFR